MGVGLDNLYETPARQGRVGNRRGAMKKGGEGRIPAVRSTFLPIEHNGRQQHGNELGGGGGCGSDRREQWGGRVTNEGQQRGGGRTRKERGTHAAAGRSKNQNVGGPTPHRIPRNGRSSADKARNATGGEEARARATSANASPICGLRKTPPRRSVARAVGRRRDRGQGQATREGGA